jgi:hypothetical protein
MFPSEIHFLDFAPTAPYPTFVGGTVDDREIGQYFFFDRHHQAGGSDRAVIANANRVMDTRPGWYRVAVPDRGAIDSCSQV